MAGVDAIVEYLATDTAGLIFANLVDFDSLYGHRNNPRGYADALEAFDRRLPEMMQALHDDDVLCITADHGNDPTDASTDHSRERVPLLIYGARIKQNHDLGTRSSFADMAASVAEFLGVDWRGPGSSFAQAILV
jgi:phosphopentomutase